MHSEGLIHFKFISIKLLENVNESNIDLFILYYRAGPSHSDRRHGPSDRDRRQSMNLMSMDRYSVSNFRIYHCHWIM